jgi:hypothetical protein
MGNKQNAQGRDPRSNESLAARSPLGSNVETFAQPAGSASMRKFGEYTFLEDSRYAGQAKS